MNTYIHQLKKWPELMWDADQLMQPLAEVRNLQGRLMGKMEALGFDVKHRAVLETIAQDVLKSNEIEGEKLDKEQVRSSLAKRLGVEIFKPVKYSAQVDGRVQMMLDAFQHYQKPLDSTRLYRWHTMTYPEVKKGAYAIRIGAWRKDTKGPMQVVSGAIGREKVHFEAPSAKLVDKEMKKLCTWINAKSAIDPVLKAGMAHLWFLTIHPFEDGNGRIGRALTDMLLARSDHSTQRFYSLSSQILKERKQYYKILEATQKGNLDITEWQLWFLSCLRGAILSSEAMLANTMQVARFWEKNQTMEFNIRQKKIVNQLLAGFEGQLTTSKWAKIAKCSADTALRDIQDLVVKGILKAGDSGGRSTHYVFD